MTANDEITPITFAEHFGNAIRVGLNWDRFIEESWRVDPVKLTSAADLKHCFMPWYIGKKGQEVAYDDPEAVPMILTDVPKAEHILNDERRNDILNYVKTFSEKGGLIEFAVPAYSLPDNKHFILDRNHRLAALSLSSLPFSVTLWTVRGPLQSECLLDLIHWLPEKAKS